MKKKILETKLIGIMHSTFLINIYIDVKNINFHDLDHLLLHSNMLVGYWSYGCYSSCLEEVKGSRLNSCIRKIYSFN